MSVRTNQDRLVMQCVMGEIQHPTVKELPVRIDCEGRVHTLPNTGSIVYNVRLGDSVYGLAGDHIEPGVTIKNYRSGSENAALNILSCIGNEAVVVSGDAKGAKGFVTGTHGGVEHVLLYFPREDLERMTIGDRIQIRALGQGLELTDYAGRVHVLNCSPAVLEKLELTPAGDRLAGGGGGTRPPDGQRLRGGQLPPWGLRHHDGGLGGDRPPWPGPSALRGHRAAGELRHPLWAGLPHRGPDRGGGGP